MSVSVSTRRSAPRRGIGRRTDLPVRLARPASGRAVGAMEGVEAMLRSLLGLGDNESSPGPCPTPDQDGVQPGPSTTRRTPPHPMQYPLLSHKAMRFTESVIRGMSIEARKYGAVNLAQGMPD